MKDVQIFLCNVCGAFFWSLNYTNGPLPNNKCRYGQDQAVCDTDIQFLCTALQSHTNKVPCNGP